jgi:hypothetical protein
MNPVDLQRLGGRFAAGLRNAVGEKVTTWAKLAIDDRSARADALGART